MAAFCSPSRLTTFLMTTGCVLFSAMHGAVLWDDPAHIPTPNMRGFGERSGVLVLVDGVLQADDLELIARILGRYSQGREADAVTVRYTPLDGPAQRPRAVGPRSAGGARYSQRPSRRQRRGRRRNGRKPAAHESHCR